MEIEGKNKICLICYGLSQTGKSSFINTLCNQQIAQVGEFGSGLSCTAENKSYGPIITQTGQEVLLIDTKAIDYNCPTEFETEKSRLKQLDFLNNSIAEKIKEYKPDELYIIITQSLEGDIGHIDQRQILYGQKQYQSTLILATKYNPKFLKISNKDQFLQEKIFQEIQGSIKDIKNNSNIEVPVMKFHTPLYDEGKNFINEEPEEFIIQQEKQLFSLLKNNLISFPFNEYLECKEQLKQIFNQVQDNEQIE